MIASAANCSRRMRDLALQLTARWTSCITSSDSVTLNPPIIFVTALPNSQTWSRHRHRHQAKSSDLSRHEATSLQKDGTPAATFSVSAVLYEASMAKIGFSSPTYRQRSLKVPTRCSEVDEIILKACELNPTARYQSPPMREDLAGLQPSSSATRLASSGLRDPLSCRRASTAATLRQTIRATSSSGYLPRSFNSLPSSSGFALDS